MARPATSPSARLKALELAKAKAAKFKRGETIAFEPMQELLGVSRRILRGWCNDIEGFEESGAFVRGDQGVNYEFHPAKTVQFLIAHFKGELANRAAKAKRLRKMVAGDALSAAPEDYSLDEMHKMLRVSNMLQESREKQGLLVDAAVTASAFREYHSSLQQAVLRAGQEQDPNGRWPPDIRESFEDAMRSILLTMERAGQDCLRALNGGAA